MTKKFLTILEAAALFKVHRNTIWLYIKSRELGAVMIGNKWQIPASELEAFSKRRTEKALQPKGAK